MGVEPTFTDLESAALPLSSGCMRSTNEYGSCQENHTERTRGCQAFLGLNESRFGYPIASTEGHPSIS